MDYVFGKGADIKKRVGLQKFLAKLSKMYEVVILTDDDTMVLLAIYVFSSLKQSVRNWTLLIRYLQVDSAGNPMF